MIIKKNCFNKNKNCKILIYIENVYFNRENAIVLSINNLICDYKNIFH